MVLILNSHVLLLKGPWEENLGYVQRSIYRRNVVLLAKLAGCSCAWIQDWPMISRRGNSPRFMPHELVDVPVRVRCYG